MEIEIHTAEQDGKQVVVLKIDDKVSILPATDAVDIGNALISAGIAHQGE